MEYPRTIYRYFRDRHLRDLDSLIGEMRVLRNPSNFSDCEVSILSVELRLLRTFLLYAKNLNHGDAPLSSLISDMEAGFRESKRDFTAASINRNESSGVHLNAAVGRLQAKLMGWRPQIKAAYGFFESHSDSQSHLSSLEGWMYFADTLLGNIGDILTWNRRISSLVLRKFEAVKEMILSIIYLVQDIQSPRLRILRGAKFSYLLTQFGAGLVRTSGACYLCWVDISDSDERMATVLSDLMMTIRPRTPQVIKRSLELLMALDSSDVTYLRFGILIALSPIPLVIMSNLVIIALFCVLAGFLLLCPIPKAPAFYLVVELVSKFLCPKSYRFGTLNQGLQHLLQFVLRAYYFSKPDTTVRLLLVESVAVLVEVGSLLYRGQEIDPAPHKLLQKTMLLVMEAILTNFNAPRSTSISLKQCHFSFIEDGLMCIRNFLGNDTVNSEPLWKYIEYIVSLTMSTSNDVRNPSLPHCSHHILIVRILEMEILLKELVDTSRTQPNVRKQVQTLHKEVVIVTTILSDTLGGLGTLEEAVLQDICSSFYSFNWNEISEDTLSSFSLKLLELLEKFMLVSEETNGMYLRDRSSLNTANFSHTPEFGFMDFLLWDLQELLNSEDVKFPMQIQVIHRDIDIFRSFLIDVGKNHYDYELSDLNSLVLRILEVALQVEYISDSLSKKDGVSWYHFPWLNSLIEDAKLIKVQISEIFNNIHDFRFDNALQSTSNVMPTAKISEIDEIVIDLIDEYESIIERLTRGTLQRDVISIVGMAGIGKTTLTRKIYNSSSVSHHFHTHAWCHVSQFYQKRKLMIEILGDIMELNDSILEMSVEDLELKLYQHLKGKRYLIVVDDLWSSESWNDLQQSFPNDENGSRILITSRLQDVVPEIKDGSIHHLRLLADAESWELLKLKVFKEEGCPEDLLALGKQIASSCDGLPLAVVTISGLLQRTDKTSDSWKQVTDSLSSLIVDSKESKCMDILQLSYTHMPHQLRLCFLYLGAFLEDKEIPVRKLIRLWIAEGLIQYTGEKNIEDVAEEYLTDLVGRSLVMASKRRLNGGIKTCCLHDMVLTLCSRICEEESFLEQVTWRDEPFASFPEDFDYGVHPYYIHQNPVTYLKRRLSIYAKRNHFVMSRPSGPHVHTLLYFPTSDLHPKCPYNISFIPGNLKRLRVLDLECINLGQTFPDKIEDLIRLRYLALSGDVDCIPNSIANLRNLQTLVLVGLKGIVLLPDNIWSMVNLQYLHVRNGAFFRFQGSQMDNSSQLLELVSLSSPLLSGVQDAENILRRFPKLRRLTCIFSDSRGDYTEECDQFPALSFLKDLRSLKLIYSGRNLHPRKFDFPLTLTKLTLSKFHLPWDCISETGKLPNLEVLKLLAGAFDGKVWDMKDGEFLKLRYLKLDNLNIVHWNASEDNVPRLQHLVLRCCKQLVGVPLSFANIYTLGIIEVLTCGASVKKSVENLKQEQMEMGNEELKILINRSD